MNIVFLYRIIHALFALVTLYFITQYLTLEEQGWYYTFLSFSALVYLFDFGLSMALIHVSAIEFVKLKWGFKGLIIGENQKRFKDFLSMAFDKYAKIGLLYFLIILPFGFFYFNQNETAKNYYWYLPWIMHVVFSTLSLLCFPFTSIVEGSGNITEIYRLKIVQILAGSILCCFLIYFSYPLYAPSMFLLSTVIITLLWLLFYRKNNFPEKINIYSSYNWKDNVSSFKNKVGITFLSSYLFVQIYTPVLFYFENPMTAGKFGLSLAIGNMLGLISSSWFVTNIPGMTKAIAENNHTKFVILFKKSFYQSTFFLIFSIIFISSIYLIFLEEEIFNRILNFYNFIGILLIILITHLINSIVIYIRCFKREPLAVPHFICSIITLIIGFYVLLDYSVSGLIITILAIQFFITIPVTLLGWKKHRQKLEI